MIIKTQFISVAPHPHPLWMQNQTFKNERVLPNNAFTSTFCWENKVGKDKKNLFIFHEVLENYTSQSTALIS